MCYLPNAKGGHAKHVETGQFTPPSTPSEEATDSQNQSLSMGAQGHDQVIKNSCGRVVEVHEGDGDFLVLCAVDPALMRRRLPCARLALFDLVVLTGRCGPKPI